MALPAMPGSPSPTPTPKPVSPDYVSPGDYLAMELGRLQALNQSQTVSMHDMVAYMVVIQSTVADAEL